MNFYNKKNRKVFTTVLVLILIVAMIVPILSSLTH